MAPTESLLEKFAELIEQNRVTVGDFSEMLSDYDEVALLKSSLPDLMKEIVEERINGEIIWRGLEAVNEKHTAAISNLQEAQKIANERHLTLLQDAIKKIESGSGVRSFSFLGNLELENQTQAENPFFLNLADLLVGILLIFIIILFFFAINFTIAMEKNELDVYH